MHYLLFCLLLSCGLLAAQGMPPLGDGADDSGTFTGSRPSGGGDTRDKGMGFGKKSEQNANENQRLQRAREEGRQQLEEADTPPPATDLDDFDAAVGLGYYYIDEGNSSMAAGYLAVAAELVDTEDYEAVLGLFTLYSLLADQAATYGDEALANTAFAAGQAIVDVYFAGDPYEEDAALMHEELGYVYYELDMTGTAAHHFADALALQPDDAYLAYMVASCLALSEETDDALAYLAYALELGLLDDGEINLAQDSDLNELRDTAEYAELAEAYGF